MFIKNITSLIVQIALSFVMIIGGFYVTPVQADIKTTSEKVAQSDFLDEDGTINLDGNVSGPINLQGWNVQLNDKQGPIFSSKQKESISSLIQSIPGEWSALGSNLAGNDGALNNGVNAIAVNGTDVYVGGGFMNAGGIEAADYIAKWDGTQWSALGSNGVGNGSLNNFVQAIAVSGGNVYVGGDFTDVNNNGTTLSTADYLAKWDGSSWSALGSNGTGNGSLNGEVSSIGISGSSIYVGGFFQNVNNKGTILTAADYIAKFNGTNWSALSNNGASNGSLNAAVDDLAVDGTNLYVGGDFTNVNNHGVVLGAADYVAKWNGTNWLALGSNGVGDGSLNAGVATVAASNGSVYVGGVFYSVNNNGVILTKADHIAKFDGTNWSALDQGGDNGNFPIGGSVYAITISGNNIFVGGHFGLAGGMPGADAVAKWDGKNWWPLGHNGIAGGSLNNDVLAIAVSGSNVYVGGYFSNVNNYGTILWPADFIASFYDMPPVTISGSVGAQGVTLGFPTSSASLADGSYSFPVPYKWSGTVTPTHPCYTFNPTSSIYNNVTTNQTQNYVATFNPASSCADVDVAISGNPVGSYVIPVGGRVTPIYQGLNNGPVRAVSTNGVNIITSERAYRGVSTLTDFNELMGFPANQLTTDYWFPLYDARPSFMATYLSIGNASTDSVNQPSANVSVYIGGQHMLDYVIPYGGRVTPIYPGINNGPVQVKSTNGVPIIASERAYRNVTNLTDFNEMMGLPASQLTTEYWFPLYDARPSFMATYLSIGNASTDSVNQPSANVSVYIGGQHMLDYVIPYGGRVTPIYPGINNGPVQVKSTNGVPIIASERAYRNVTNLTDFNEMMGLPASQLTTEYWFPLYDARPSFMATYLSIGNASTDNVNQPGANVSVYIGGQHMLDYVIPYGGRVTPIYPGINNGPVQVKSTNGVPIIASERAYRNVTNLTDFNELMGFPANQLTTDYWFPLIDSTSFMQTYLTIGVP